MITEATAWEGVVVSPPERAFVRTSEESKTDNDEEKSNNEEQNSTGNGQATMETT